MKVNQYDDPKETLIDAILTAYHTTRLGEAVPHIKAKDYVQKAFDALTRTPKEGWREIETAPETGQVLGWVPCQKRGDRIEIVKLKDGQPFVVGSEFAFDRAPVTHWQPLPPPPTGADQ